MMTRPRKFIQEYNPTASIIIIPVFVAVINQKIQNNIAKIIITKTDNDDDDEEMLICRHSREQWTTHEKMIFLQNFNVPCTYSMYTKKYKRILLVSWPQFLWQLCSFFLLPLFVMLWLVCMYCVPTFQRQCNVMFETSYHFTIFIPPNNQNIFIDLCAYIIYRQNIFIILLHLETEKERRKNIILFSVSCVPRFYS